jgi:chemotaxis protein CheZ
MPRGLKPFRIEHYPGPGPALPSKVAEKAAGEAHGPSGPDAQRLDVSPADLVALRSALSAGAGLSRAADELAAIVNDTARAANVIIGASEEIDNLVLRLRATAGRETGSDLADELAENSQMIFQACGFQDLTGQRIANVVDVLHEFERKLSVLRKIWDGVAERRVTGVPANDRAERPAPLSQGLENGPRLPADAGHLSQSEIDAIFD